MSLRWRPMRPNDVRECVRIVAEHPVFGPRYGNAITYLAPAWLRLLGNEAMTTAVFEEVDGDRRDTWGVGVGVFVSDDFIRELKAHPFWFGPELAKRVIRGSSPVLSDAEVRQANSRHGLNLLVWETLPRPAFAKRFDAYQSMANAYIEIHRGFLLNEMITSQAESVERLQWAVDAGGLYWDPLGQCYTKSLQRDTRQFIKEPHIVGITRQAELDRPGSWVGVLFNYHPPRFGFSPSERSLLLAALAAETGTDYELAKALGLSLPTIKKTWLSIYDRVVEGEPTLIPGHNEAGPSVRGKEKRRGLLAYIREHPEELRPTIRNRPDQNARGSRP